MSTIDPPSPFIPGVHPASTAPAGAADARQAGMPPSRPRSRRSWMWAAAVAAAFLLALAASLLATGLGWAEPIRVFVDGEQVYGGPDFDSLSVGELFALSCAGVLALVVTLLVVPLAVVGTLVAVTVALAVAVVVGLGLPLLIVVLVVGLLLSPLILLGWLLVKLLT